MASAVLPTVNAEGSSDNVSRIKELIAYMNNSSENPGETYSYDINCDNSVNILDLIYAKGTVSDNLNIDTEKQSVYYMNSIAYTIFNVAQTAAQELETAGEKLSDRTFSSEDMKKLESFSDSDQKILKQINIAAEYHKIKKWAVSVKNYCVLACVTGDDIIQRTGAYPNNIPQKFNIPFSNELVEQATSYLYDWGTDYNEFISINPAQSSLPDYPLSVTLKLRTQIAKRLYTDLQTAAQELETMGVSVDGIIKSDDDNELIEELQKNCYYEDSYVSYNYSKEDGVHVSNRLKWTADIRDNIVYGVIFEDRKYNCCGAYPNMIPYSMNVPYSPELIEYVCDINKDWKTDYPQYITDNKEQLQIAQVYSKISTSELNSYAKTIFTGSIMCFQKYLEKYDVKNVDEIFNDPQMEKKFAEDLIFYLSVEVIKSGVKWDYFIVDGEIKGIIVSDENITGAYPNSVPENMSIPYSSDLAKYSYGSENLWENDFKEYAEDNESVEVPPYVTSWVEKATINSFNSNAKSVFTSATSAVIDCMISGYEIQDGIISSDDNSEFTQMIRSTFVTSSSNPQWAVYVSDGEVRGVVFSDSSKKYTGAYPNTVPNDCVVAYEHALASKAADNNAKWQK